MANEEYNPEPYMTVKLPLKWYSGELRLEKNKYAVDGSLALLAYEDNGELYDVFSVNCSEYGLYPEPGSVFIKDYGEHEGLASMLEQAGAGKITDHSIPIGGFDAKVVEFKLNEKKPAVAEQE